MARPEGLSAYAKKSAGYDYGGWVISRDGKTSQLKSLTGVRYGGTYDFERVAKVTGVDHWIRKDGYWLPDPKGQSSARPCCKPVTTNERWSHHGPCDKPIKENGLCGTHARQVVKRAEADQKYKDERDRSDAGSRIARDAVEALDARGVKAVVNYESGYKASDFHGYDGRVKVHAEDIIALLRKIEHLEQGL